MPIIKQNIEQRMKMDSTPLVYLEYMPKQKPVKKILNLKKPFTKFFKNRSNLRFAMGYVSHPYPETYRITTCRHLVIDANGVLPSKIEILEGLEVYACYQGVNQKMHRLLFEDVNVKVHTDPLTDLLFIEITRPTHYNFHLLEQAEVRCQKRFPGSQVYYFQNHPLKKLFQLFEGVISTDKLYIINITNEGFYFFEKSKPTVPFRTFDTIDTTKEVLIKGASGSPILSRKGEVVGMICAHDLAQGRGIYLPIEKIERLYAEIEGFHT